MAQDEHKEDSENEAPADEAKEEDSNSTPFATLEELEKGRLPPQDILSLPMFKVWILGSSYNMFVLRRTFVMM